MANNIIPFGLLELNAAGTVLLYEPVNKADPLPSPKSIRGRNIFTEVVPFSQVKGLQYRFDAFVNNGEAEQRFVLSLPYNYGQVKIRFLLSRLAGRTARTTERMAVVQITPDMEEADHSR